MVWWAKIFGADDTGEVFPPELMGSDIAQGVAKKLRMDIRWERPILTYYQQQDEG